MKHTKRTFSMMVIATGMALVLAACSSDASPADDSSAAPAADQNVAANAPAPNAGANGGRGGGPGVTGQVTAINGNTITVQDPRQQGTTQISFSDSTQVFKQATIALANAPVGETVNAFGVQAGDLFTATRVQIGATGGFTGTFGGRNGRPTGQAPQNGTPRAGASQGGQFGGNRGQRLVGTIEKASADSLTIKTSEGATVQLHLGTNGQLLQTVAGTKADITTGEQIRVMGEQSDAGVTASRIDVMAAQAPQP